MNWSIVGMQLANNLRYRFW